MLEYLQVFVLITMSLASVCFNFWLIRMVVRTAILRRKRNNGRTMVDRARLIGPWVYYNEVGKFLAICRADEFQQEVREQMSDLPAWQSLKQVVLRRTFVFCDDDSLRNRMHVDASREQFRSFSKSLVKTLTGFSEKSVDQKSFREAESILFRRSTQLFVPWTKELTKEEWGKLIGTYGPTPQFREVRKIIGAR